MLNKSGAKPFKCEHCHYSTKRAFDLRRHMQRHTKVKPLEGTEFKCSECAFTTKWKRNMGRHMRTHDIKQPTEDETEETYEEILVELIEPSDAQYAIEDAESSTTEVETIATPTEITMKLFVCGQCQYTTNRAFDLRRHELTHSRPKIADDTTAYECLKCQFRTKWKRNIVRHVRMHAELSIENNVQELDDQSTEELMVELMNTEDNNPDTADNVKICLANSDSQLTEYEITEYPQPTSPANREKRFKCTQCHYESKRAFDLRRHERRHTKVRTVDGTAVKCTECSFVTKWKRNMKRHMQQHKTRAVPSDKSTWEEESLVELVNEPDSEVETYSLSIEPSIKSEMLDPSEIDRELVSPLYELLESDDDDKDPEVLPSHWLAVQE
ncbi:zinc finger protein ZFAT-like [Drosophila albomicans]|uniref:Zinc finger protein ZFAT-like n=1 Tax=Drosophila albomicans TaxID=7291 RepID=A0A6P8WER9_DROAB|nr:zinc finger protein ZFAT-like [Drosophila albomicans]